VAAEENVQEIDMEAEVAAPEVAALEVATLEVAEVLAEVPKSSRTLRLKPTPTKETPKDNKESNLPYRCARRQGETHQSPLRRRRARPET